MSGPAHIELQAALDAERAKCAALQAEIERLRGLLSREQQERHAALAEVDRITEAGRVHIRRAAAFEAQRDELAAWKAKIEAQPPVAVIGDTYSLLWAQPGTMPEIVRRCGIKVGSLLYARPVPAAAPERASMSIEDAMELHAIADGTKIRPAAAPERAEPADAELVAAEWPDGFEKAVQSLPTLADAVALFDEPERAEPAANELPTRCTECGQLGWHKMSCSHVAHERGARITASSAPEREVPRFAPCGRSAGTCGRSTHGCGRPECQAEIAAA